MLSSSFPLCVFAQNETVHVFNQVDAKDNITLVALRRYIRRKITSVEKEGCTKLLERVVLEGGTAFTTVLFENYETFTPIEAAALILQEIQQAVEKSPTLNLKTIFRMIDRDRSGTIDKLEFSHVLKKFKISLNDEEINNVFQMFDDGDGELSVGEFLVAVNNRVEFIRDLVKAEMVRKQIEQCNSLKHFDDPTKTFTSKK